MASSAPCPTLPTPARIASKATTVYSQLVVTPSSAPPPSRGRARVPHHPHSVVLGSLGPRQARVLGGRQNGLLARSPDPATPSARSRMPARWVALDFPQHPHSLALVAAPPPAAGALQDGVRRETVVLVHGGEDGGVRLAANKCVRTFRVGLHEIVPVHRIVCGQNLLQHVLLGGHRRLRRRGPPGARRSTHPLRFWRKGRVRYGTVNASYTYTQ